MKKFSILVSLMIAAMSAVSCYVSDIEKTADNKEGVAFQLYATTESETRTTIDNNMNTSWSEGDQINVFHIGTGDADYTNDGAFTAADAFSNLFNGTTVSELSPSASYDWYAFYPYASAIETPGQRTRGYICIGSATGQNQIQTGNDNNAHISGSNVPLYGRVLGVYGSETPHIQMHQLASVVKVKVTNTTSNPLTVSSVSFTSPKPIIGTYFIDITGESLTETDYVPSGNNYVSNTANLVVSNATPLNTNDVATFYIVIKPFTVIPDSEHPELSDLKVSVNGYEKTISLTKETAFSAGKIKTINFNYDNEAPSVTGTYSYSFTSKVFESQGSLPLGDLLWNLNTDGGYFGYGGEKGQQIGSGSSPATCVSMSTLKYVDDVNNITINTSGANGIVASLSVTVNGVSYKSDGVAEKSISSSNAAYVFIPDGPVQSGEIIISWANNSGKAIYVKSIAINEEIDTTPVFTLIKTNISNVSASGVSDATETNVYSIENATDSDVVVTCDGTIVTSASISEGTLTYSVSENTGDAREGWIKLLLGSQDNTITVSQFAGNLAGYTLVSDASTLSAGDVIVLGTEAYSKAAGIIGSNVYFSSVDAIIENGILSCPNAAEITLCGSIGNWMLLSSEGLVGANDAKMISLNKGTYTWTIDINNCNAEIQSTNSSYGCIQYNSSNPRFLNYTSSQAPIQIYKKTDDSRIIQILTYSSTTGNLDIFSGITPNLPTLTGAQTSVTYLSSNEAAATVSADGTITARGVGTTTITAIAVGNETYKPAVASFTLTVTNSVPVIVSESPAAVAADATSVEVAYTVTNAVPGTSLSAAVTEGDWITNPDVSGNKVTFSLTANTGSTRTGTVTLSYAGADDKVITITQNGAGGASNNEVSGTLASWSFTSASYPSNKTNYISNGSNDLASGTFYLNGTGSTWNTSKGFAFTAVTDVTITVTAAKTLKAGSTITFSMDAFYNKASNAPVTGYNLTTAEGSATPSTNGLSVTSISLSASSSTKSVVYTLQNDVEAGGTVKIVYTQTGKVGAGQAYINNVVVAYSAN